MELDSLFTVLSARTETETKSSWQLEPGSPNKRSGLCSSSYKWVDVNHGKMEEGKRQRHTLLGEESWVKQGFVPLKAVCTGAHSRSKAACPCHLFLTRLRPTRGGELGPVVRGASRKRAPCARGSSVRRGCGGGASSARGRGRALT